MFRISDLATSFGSYIEKLESLMATSTSSSRIFNEKHSSNLIHTFTKTIINSTNAQIRSNKEIFGKQAADSKEKFDQLFEYISKVAESLELNLKNSSMLYSKILELNLAKIIEIFRQTATASSNRQEKAIENYHNTSSSMFREGLNIMTPSIIQGLSNISEMIDTSLMKNFNGINAALTAGNTRMKGKLNSFVSQSQTN